MSSRLHLWGFMAPAAAFSCGILALSAMESAPAFGQRAPTASGPDVIEHGRALFMHECAPCHGAGPGDDGAPMLPGTAALDAKYKGELPAALERRADLDVDIVRFFVRNGAGSMPMFRKAELSDADIDAITAYMKSDKSRP